MNLTKFQVIKIVTIIILTFAMSLLAIALFQFITGEFSINRDIGILVIFSIFFTVFFRSLFSRKKTKLALSKMMM
jgi:hypothetical protein